MEEVADQRLRKPETVASVIRAGMDRKGINVAETARRLGMNRVNLYTILRSKRPVSLAMCVKFGEVLPINAYGLARLQFEQDWATLPRVDLSNVIS